MGFKVEIKIKEKKKRAKREVREEQQGGAGGAPWGCRCSLQPKDDSRPGQTFPVLWRALSHGRHSHSILWGTTPGQMDIPEENAAHEGPHCCRFP